MGIKYIEKQLAKNPNHEGLKRELARLRGEQPTVLPAAAPKAPAPKAPKAVIDVAAMSAKDAIAYIKSIEEYSDLERARDQETGREKGARTTVIDALDAAEEAFE
jgi:hypothetical protein